MSSQSERGTSFRDILNFEALIGLEQIVDHFSHLLGTPPRKPYPSSHAVGEGLGVRATKQAQRRLPFLPVQGYNETPNALLGRTLQQPEISNINIGAYCRHTKQTEERACRRF